MNECQHALLINFPYHSMQDNPSRSKSVSVVNSTNQIREHAGRLVHLRFSGVAVAKHAKYPKLCE